MKRIILSTAVTAAAALNGYAMSPDTEKKPDVLFIFLDDLTFNGLSSLGDKDVISPNMDRIVKSGVSFTNAYNQGGWNGAISAASRSQLMTGLYLWNTESTMRKDKYKTLYSERKLWPQVMEDAGYKTFHTGKWHMSHITPQKIYENVATVRPGMPADNVNKPERRGYNRPLSRDDNSWMPWDKSHGGFWNGGEHWSVVDANHTIEFMKQNKDSKEPLFICAAFNAPHDPRQSPKEYVDMYDVDEITVPKSFVPQNPLMEEMASGRELRDEQLAPWPRTEYAVQKHRQEYYAIITHLDDQIGRILDYLEESGRADNTLIIFSADNGLGTGRHGYIGKQSMYEHSMKIPLVFAGCGLPKGETRKQLVYLQDLVPTLYEMIGIETPKQMQFISQLDVVKKGRAESKRDAVYGAYLDKQRMIRDERHKLFCVPDAKKVMLFDVVKDPEELTDLYGKNAKYDNIAKCLAQKYLETYKATGDKFNLMEIYPELFN